MTVFSNFIGWYQSSYRNQLFSILSLFIVFIVFSVTLISELSTEKTADYFINNRLLDIKERWAEVVLELDQFVPISSNSLILISSKEDKKPRYLNSIDKLGIQEFDFGRIHVLTFESPIDKDWLHLVYFSELDTELGNYHVSRPYVIGMSMMLLAVGVLSAMVLAEYFGQPLKTLAGRVADPHSDFTKTSTTRKDEIGVLHRASQKALCRVEAFVERERQFTRFASHELRNPVHVIQGAIDVLKIMEKDQKKQAIISRIDTSNKEMELLIEVFLMLGREYRSAQPNQLVSDIIESCLSQANSRECQVALEIRSSAAISEVFGKIVIGNLVRNSLAYSQAIVDIHLSGNRLVIRNDLSASQIRGYGYGKEIVSAVCQAAGWCYYSNVNDKRSTSVVYF